MKDRWFCIDNQFYNLSKFWKLKPFAIKDHGEDKRFVILGYLNFIDPRPQVDLKLVKHSKAEAFIGEDSLTTYDDCLIRIQQILAGKYDIHSSPSVVRLHEESIVRNI